MTARALMIQGTGSDVGKSLLVAGLCRAAVRRGLQVRPFKPQNMSNNAAVAADGGEIGRAQALQALACGVAPSLHMNPVLIKPHSDSGAQLVVQGQPWRAVEAGGYQAIKPHLVAPIQASFDRLRDQADLVIVEGAGSPAEVNLRSGDVANMGFARRADVPVILAGDIDRGGVIAALVGTHAVLDPGDRDMINGFIINKFRGDIRLFSEGPSIIERHTGWRSYGVLPYLPEAASLPAEDAAGLVGGRNSCADGGLKIIVPILSRIANFDDLDPLRLESGVSVEMVPAGRPLPLADIILLPGSKATLADLAFLRAQGWDIDILAHARRGGRIVGICGGYQLLGRIIADPLGLEGPAGSAPGLGLLDVMTELHPAKTVRVNDAHHLASGLTLDGYEIHAGVTDGADCARPLFRLADGRLDGAQSADGRVIGTYLHGLFSADDFRRHMVSAWGAVGDPLLSYRGQVERVLDVLADRIEACLALDDLLALAR